MVIVELQGYKHELFQHPKVHFCITLPLSDKQQNKTKQNKKKQPKCKQVSTSSYR